MVTLFVHSDSQERSRQTVLLTSSDIFLKRASFSCKKMFKQMGSKKTEQNQLFCVTIYFVVVVFFFFMSVPFNIGPSNTEKEQMEAFKIDFF